MTTHTKLIAHIEQFIALSEKEKNCVAAKFYPRTLKKKEMLYALGAVCRYQCFVLSGSLKIFFTNKDAQEYISYFATENTWAVDLKSFVHQNSSFYNIQALEKSQLLQISKTDLDELLKQIPKLEKWVRYEYEAALISSEVRIEENMSLEAAQRYLKFQEKYPGLENRISQKNIAAYLGITPEFLSMIRSRRVKEQ